MKTGILNTKNQSIPGHRGILRPTASTRHKTPLGNFRFLPEVTVKDTLTQTEEIISKAPRPYNTFVTTKKAPLDEGGIIDDRFILEQVHTVLDYLLAVDSSMVIYTYSGKIQHSPYVLPYKKKHTRILQSKRHRKVVSVPELKRYTD